MQTKVLVVDDNRDSIAILRGFLKTRGYSMTAAADGIEALDCLRKEPFDLVLLDVMMPGMNGFDVLAHMRREGTTAAIPVILLTAKTADEDLLTGYDRGADYYITKPFTPEQLFYGIEIVLGTGEAVG